MTAKTKMPNQPYAGVGSVRADKDLRPCDQTADFEVIGLSKTAYVTANQTLAFAWFGLLSLMTTLATAQTSPLKEPQDGYSTVVDGFSTPKQIEFAISQAKQPATGVEKITSSVHAKPLTTGSERSPREYAKQSSEEFVRSLSVGIQPRVPAPVSHGPYANFMGSYRDRARKLVDPQGRSQSDEPTTIASMWWEKPMLGSIGLSDQAISVNVDQLTESALASSPLVRSIMAESKIRSCDIVIADAEFDPTAFLEGKFTDTNEPIGNALTTGDNSDRFRDETFTAVGGIRKKTRGGASLEVLQRTGFQENNSQFLDPNPQGTTRLEFNFTQPLLRDRGRGVNNIRVLLAKLDYQTANASVRTNLENHLIEVAQAYWDLYLARADWLQRKQLLVGAERLHRILQARSQVDSQKRQLLRAQAAMASRKSALVRATTRIRDIQAQLRLLTGSNQLAQAQAWELVPQEMPLTALIEVSTKQSVITALDNRADIARAIRTVQAVSARVGAAKNQVLPRLDLILGTYTAGLDDRRNVFGAWSNQFNDGRPTYWAGLAYEIPIRNRASKARLQRNRWELARSISDFRQTTEVAFTEVEVAVRETRTAYNELLAKQQAVKAANNEVEYLQQRWELLPDPNESAVLLIEDLLDAQDRLTTEERSYASSQVAYALSWLQLRKVMGTLLRYSSCDENANSIDANMMHLSNDPQSLASERMVSPEHPRTVSGNTGAMLR